MHRIDGSTRSASLPAPLPTGTGSASPGFFAHGDALGGVPPTIVSPDWANAVQEEIAHVIEESGADLDKTDNGQLRAAIVQMIADALGGATGFLIRSGTYRGSITSETSVTVAFDSPFPTACLARVATGYVASGDIHKNLYPQIVGAASTTGMTVFFQSPTDEDKALDGFDYIAIGR